MSLCQQAERHALDFRAAQHGKRSGISASVPRAFQRKRAVLCRAGKNVAFRRVHAEFITAGSHFFKGEPSVFIRFRAGDDHASRAVHQLHFHAGKRAFALLPHAIAVLIHPDCARQRAHAHNACAYFTERIAAGNGQHARSGNRIVALLHAASGHAAFRRGEAAVRFFGRKAHAIASRRDAFKSIAAVFRRLRRGDDFARAAQQLDRRAPAIGLVRAKLRIRVIVVIDHAGNRAGKHRADIHLHARLPHRQGKRLASAGGKRRLRHVAGDLAACGGNLPRCAPLARQLIGNRILAGADARKGHVAFFVGLIGDGFRVLAVFDVNQRHADAFKILFIRALHTVRLRILEHVDGQLRRDGHARIDAFHIFADVQVDRLRTSAAGKRAVDGGILAISCKRPFAVQLKEHAVRARVEVVKPIASARVRRRLGHALGMAVLRPEQHHANAGNRFRAVVNHPVAVCIHAHRAGNRRALAERHRAEINRVALFQFDGAADFAILRVGRQVALRQGQHRVIPSGQNAGKIESSVVARHDDGRLFVARLFHFKAQAAKTDRLAVLQPLKHRAVDFAGIDATHIDDVVAVVAIDNQRVAQPVVRVAHRALHMFGIQRAVGKHHAAARVKLHGIYAAGNRRKFIPAVRARAAAADHLAGLIEQRHVQSRITGSLVRAHQAVGVAIHKRHAADFAVHARGSRRKRAASRHSETVASLGAAGDCLPPLVCAHEQRAVKARLHVKLRFSVHTGFDIKRNLSRRKAAVRPLFARLGVQIGDAHRIDVVLHIRQTDRRRAGEHVRHPRLGGPPAAARQTVFHARPVLPAAFIRRGRQHKALDLHPRAALFRHVDLRARLNQRFSFAHRAHLCRQQRQSLFAGRVHVSNQPVDLLRFGQGQTGQIYFRRRAALRQIRRDIDRDFVGFAQRVTVCRLNLTQRIDTDRHSHRVAIGGFAHLKIQHGFAVFIQQFKSSAGDVAARSRIQHVEIQKSPVAGNRACQHARFARRERHFIRRFVPGKACRAAQFAQIVRRALHRGGQSRADSLLAIWRRVCPDGELFRRGRIRRKFAVFHGINAVFARQRHNVSLQLIVERQARLIHRQQRVFFQRHICLLRFAADNGHGLLARKRIALRHLCLVKHIGTRRQAAHVKCVARLCQIKALSVGSQQLKAHLRHLLFGKRASRERRAHAAERIHTGQRDIRLLRVAHGETRGLRRSHACREILHLCGIFARLKAHLARPVLIGLQFNTRVVHPLAAVLHAVQPDRRAGKWLHRRVSVCIKPLQTDRETARSMAFMQQLNLRRFTRRGQRLHLCRVVITFRRALGADRRLAERHQRRDGCACVIRRHGIAVSVRIGHGIGRARNRAAVFIDAAKHQSRLRRFKDNGFLTAGQFKRLRLRQNVQSCRILFRQPQHVFAAQRFHGHAAVLQRNIPRDDRSVHRA